MASLIYPSGLVGMLSDVGLLSVTVRLMGPGYVPSTAHETVADLRDESSGEGYKAGGRAVTTTAARDGDEAVLTIGGAVWTPVTVRAQGAVYAAGDRLLAYADFGEVVSATRGAFTLPPTELRFGMVS